MRSHVRFALILAPVVVLGGCRQADGGLPTPDTNAQEDLKDISRGLIYIATGYDTAASAEDLAYDLRKYAEPESTIPAVNELSRRTATAVANKKLSEQTAQRLAHTLWLSIEARELSERQIEGLQNDTQSLLMSIGVTEDEAQQVAAQVGEVQKAVTTRLRRWYEWF